MWPLLELGARGPPTKKIVRSLGYKRTYMQGIRINLIRIGVANFFKNSDLHPDSSSDSKISLQNLNFFRFL